MMALKTVPWDVAERLDTPEGIANYLEAVFEIGDAQLIAAALGDVARARGVSGLAKETGLSRESLYKALATGGNPEFATVMKVVNAFGLRLAAVATTVGRRKSRGTRLVAKPSTRAPGARPPRTRAADA
jgi:probable addiction module antidote protein